MDSGYSTPIVLVIFNRPRETSRVFEAIAARRPATLLVVSDGPRPGHATDADRVRECRQIVSRVDWDCKVLRNYSDKNLGCMRRPVSGFSWAFELVEEAVILEDDCLPTEEFFRFCSWGLDHFRHIDRVGMVCGSNLIDYLMPISTRNVYSSLVSPWGWATWRRTWEAYDPTLALADLKDLKETLVDQGMPRWERAYWLNVFKHAIGSNSIWDLRLQYVFFRDSLVSVFPARNLIRNIGFSTSATHTRSEVPEYVLESEPEDSVRIMDRPVASVPEPDRSFDRLLARTIWSSTPMNAARLFVTNLIRYASI